MQCQLGRYDILYFTLAASCCAGKMRSPLLHPQCNQQRRRKKKKSPKPSKWLTGETERETALPLKRFETFISSSSADHKEHWSVLGRRFLSAFCTPQWFAWQVPAQGLSLKRTLMRPWKWCWCDVNVSDLFSFFNNGLKDFWQAFLLRCHKTNVMSVSTFIWLEHKNVLRKHLPGSGISSQT